MADKDPTNLHDLAVDIQTDLQKLATGLAHAGASPQAVAQLTKMAEIVGQVVKVLASGPPLPGDGAPEQAGQAPPAPAGSPAPAAPAGSPAPAQPAAPTPVQHSIASATHSLHAAMQQSAQQRRA